MKSSVTTTYYFLRRMTKRMWFRASVYAAIGVATAFLALIGRDFIPLGEFTKIGSNAVGNILGILASSMLAVATFSLSIMVTAFGNVSSGATPRASRLLIENQSAQRAVATFIGAFLYSIVGLIALTTGAYGEQGRFLLFIVTVLVIIIIVATLIRWVDQLATLGRVGDTISQIEKATREAIIPLKAQPRFGAGRLPADFSRVHAVIGEQVGYINFIDFPELEKLCEKQDLHLYFESLPGGFVYPQQALCFSDKSLSPDLIEEIESHVIIEESRSFEQDPRFGFILLSEIASKALSSAVNDPGTVIEVLNAAVRLFQFWAKAPAKVQDSPSARIFVADLSFDEIFSDVFARSARDGSGLVEVATKIQHALKSLAELSPAVYGSAANLYAAEALRFANESLKSDLERKTVASIWPRS